MGGMPGMGAASAGTASFAASAVMWAVMMMAMMLPGMTLATVARGARFAAGYALMWLAFSAAAAAVQWSLGHGGHLSAAMALQSAPLAALVVAGVGLYELTPFKHAWLRRCRSNERRPARPDATARTTLFDGVRHGVLCLGCCWPLMALMFVGGVMNLAWSAAVALLVLAEKAGPARIDVARAAGVALLLGGAVMGFRAVS